MSSSASAAPAPEPAATASPPAIDPANVRLNLEGFAFRSIFVRLPEGLAADDLKEPAIWRAVQPTPARLRDFDQLVMVAYDQSWLAEAVVAFADATRVVLAKPRLTTFPPRYDRPLEDARYRIVWGGTGYVVERKHDGHRMTHPAATVALAERDLRHLYPRPVA
ncbi:MAG: hypothetical protein KIT36_16185 [Alphaproteobacteria bacterium]|nr:hypothetical protein [Alphaproteobacteria bacterium]